ncbi:MAG: hypothetical protein J0I06_15195 [Planctomycetes bacterium]|nr:hypothetical protein [Planctomycetota bacterium]
MRWKSVAWVSCLLPVLAGCGSTSRVMWAASGGGVANDPAPVHTRGGQDELRRDAQTAWQTVAAGNPGRSFSDEFREGFADGYVDFLERGVGSQPPAVPPVAYERYKRYFGRDGHGLVRDYYLGFQYGGEVAIVTGRRPGTAVPGPPGAGAVTESAPRPLAPLPSAVGPKPPDVAPPRAIPNTGKFGEPRKVPGEPPILLPPPPDAGDGRGNAIPPLPKPELPVIKPFNPDLSGGKFAPISVPPEPDRLPMPSAPFPVSEPVRVPFVVPPDESKSPAPPPKVLSVLDDIPVIPLRPTPK